MRREEYQRRRELQRPDKIFADVMPTMKRFRSDLKAAEVEFQDADGRRADFHSLRHTFCTNLQRGGVDQRALMGVMRHGDRRQSDYVYTDSKLLPLADAVESLPSFAAIQIATQEPDANGHSVSPAVAGILAAEDSSPLVLRGKRHEPTRTGAESPESEDGARYRVRT